MHKIQIETDPKLTGLELQVSKKIIIYTLEKEKIESSEITVIFGDKTLLRNLKKEFFQIDRTTDVIAFRLNEYEGKYVEGEIYICLPVAKENAFLYNESYEMEIARLIIHGGLHLIGYDDDTEEHRKEMRKLENKYLKELEF
jgi:rRNA maturation RNase YbeY